MSRRAVVLAGGKGTRLRPYTVVLPKPLMPVGEYPILEVIVRQLRTQGFDRITMAVNHQANLIRAFFGEGSQWGIAIDYSLESTPLSTIGPLKLITDLPDQFLLMNGDVLTDLSFSALFDQHKASGAAFTVSAARRRHTIDYGVLSADDSGALVGFDEKPSVDYLVSRGVYVMNRAVLETVPTGAPYGFDHLMKDLLARRERVNVLVHDGYWLDIGRPDDYLKAIEEFDQRKTQLLKDASAYPVVSGTTGQTGDA
jgi:NDP-sugar pyrophosphorylase family protein